MQLTLKIDLKTANILEDAIRAARRELRPSHPRKGMKNTQGEAPSLVTMKRLIAGKFEGPFTNKVLTATLRKQGFPGLGGQALSTRTAWLVKHGWIAVTSETSRLKQYVRTPKLVAWGRANGYCR